MLLEKSILIFVLCCSIASMTTAQCPCQPSNGVACINNTHFYICNGGEPVMTVPPNECPTATQYCSLTGAVCTATQPQTPITCGASGGAECGACAAPGFTCVSATEYSVCIAAGSDPLGQTPCPEGELCSMDLYAMTTTDQKFCAPEAVLAFYGFNSTCPALPPTAPTTPNPDTLRGYCREAESTSGGARFYYIKHPTDTTCRMYIYCEKRPNNLFDAVLFRCENSYYDNTTKRCVANRPADC